LTREHAGWRGKVGTFPQSDQSNSDGTMDGLTLAAIAVDVRGGIEKAWRRLGERRRGWEKRPLASQYLKRVFLGQLP
jgi:hypothetical protein